MPSSTGTPDLGKYRVYLHLLARQHLDQRLRGKLDSSDIVQQALLQAHQSREQFRGDTEAERIAWLRQILGRCLANALRDFTREKRDIARERSIEEALNESSARVDEWLAAEHSTPSQGAEKHEETLRLAEALAKLPDAQREALLLHHWEDWSLAQIGEKLERSPTAVAGLIKRGLKQLRSLLQEGETHDG